MTELYQISQLIEQTPCQQAIELENRLKEEFQKVFSPLTKLPPIRSIDHSIQLVPNTQPMSLKPYKYSHI